MGDGESNGEWVPYPYYKTTDGKLHRHNKKVNMTTPGGKYRIEIRRASKSIYDDGGPGYMLALIPVDKDSYETDKYLLAMHGETKKYRKERDKARISHIL